MQGALFEPNDLPKLAEPDPISHAFFEAPTLPALGIIALAVLGAYTVRSTGYPKAAALILLSGLLLGISMFVSATLVTTDREIVTDRLRLLVASVAQGSENGLTDALDPDVVVNTRFVSASGRDNVMTLSLTRAAPRVSEHSVGEIQVELLGPRVARTHARIKTQGDSFPTLSWWRVDWVRDSIETDLWRATHIEPLWIQGFDRAAG